MNLFWLETDDHAEDWFIVARDEAEAVTWFAGAEGYFDDEPRAKLVQPLDDGGLEVGWPNQALLDKLGAETKVVSGARIVKLNGETFCEGMMESVSDVFKSVGQSLELEIE